MAEDVPQKERSEAVWKRGWFVGGVGAVALLLLGVLLGVTLSNSTTPSAGETTVTTPSTALSTESTSSVAETTTTTQSATSTTATLSTTTITTTVSGVGWDSTEAAVASMIACGSVGECEVEWPVDDPTAPEMPKSIPGYDREGPTERSDFRVLGDGSTAKSTLFPYLLGDCATQIWTARWRSVTGESLSAAVIPPTPEAPFDEPWNPDWGEPPAPSEAGFLAGFGCTQPAWTFTDSDPEYVIIADGVVEWQIWFATP